MLSRSKPVKRKLLFILFLVKKQPMPLTLTRTLLIIFLLLGFGAWQENRSVENEPKVYVCPPCGCSADHVEYNHMGFCRSCRMPLIEKPTGLKGEFSAFLRKSYKNPFFYKLYPKVLYPAFVLGIFLSVVSLVGYFIGRKRVINPFLAVLIITISLYGFKNQLYGVPYALTSYIQALFVPISFISIIGPVLFLYNKSMLISKFRLRKKDWLHFIPGALFFAWYIMVFTSGSSNMENQLHSRYEVKISHFEQIFATLSIILYAFFGFRMFNHWKNKYVLGNKDILKWLKKFNWAVLSIALSWLILIVLNYWIFDFGIATMLYQVLWVVLAVFLYWIAFEILRKPSFFLLKKPDNGTSAQKVLKKEELDKIIERLSSLMSEDKLFLNDKLSLNEVAEKLDLNPKYLSLVLNNAMGMNFYEFINKYRIEEVKRLFHTDRSKLTIEAIANKAGFNSKSSFNKVFKKETGLTPRDFIKSL